MPYTNEERRRYQVIYRKERRSWALKYLGGVCKRCGSDQHLHFDHIDPTTKTDSISTLIAKGVSLDVLKSELDKCQLLCSDCHLYKTAEDGTYDARKIAQHGTLRMYQGYKCRCQLCVDYQSSYQRARRALKKQATVDP